MQMHRSKQLPGDFTMTLPDGSVPLPDRVYVLIRKTPRIRAPGAAPVRISLFTL